MRHLWMDAAVKDSTPVGTDAGTDAGSATTPAGSGAAAGASVAAANGGPGAGRAPRAWVPRLAGFLCLLIGLRDILVAVFPRLRDSWLPHASRYVPGAVTNAATAATLVTGILLILLALALRRRKRRAWRAVLVLLSISVLLHVFRHLAVISLVLAVLGIVGLVVYRDEFYAAGDPRTRWRAIGTFFLLAVVSCGLGLLIVGARPRALLGHPSLLARLHHVLYGLIGIHGPLVYRTERVSDLVSALLFGLGLLTVLTSAYLFFRPAEPPARLSTTDETRLRELLAKHGGRDSLGYFALRRDKAVIWSPTGKAAVAYRVVSGVMLASGDPIGDPEAWPGVIKRFIAEADRHAWIPAVVGCSEQGGEIWAREGRMDALELGDEAIVEVAEFSLDGRAMRNVRQMVKRIERAGYSCEMRRVRDIGPEERRQMRAQAASWRGTETERGFSMALGRFGDPADGDCVLVTAVKDGVVRAFLHFVPWGEDGLSLDLMRRDRGADPGLNELCIVAALRGAAGLGVNRVSLNFAVFRSALERGERIGAGPVLRAWRGVLLFLSRWFQIESLYRFNAKFRPCWEPRFVVFRRTAELPRIAIAALEAEAFLVMPSLRRSRERRRDEPAAVASG